jgi:hypothetical protein
MLKQLQKEVREMKDSLSRTSLQHLSIEGNELDIHFEPDNKVYIPTPTGERFHASNQFVRLVLGPYGSGKSTMCCMELVKRACEMPKWLNGVRRSKWAVVRNTTGELTSTTLQTWLSWFGELGDITKRQKPILNYTHTFNDGDGIVEIELIFLALDREDDLRKIRSLEVTGCYINELSEVPSGALAHFKGRVGRYPSTAFCHDPYWSGIICDSNPTDIDHWMPKLFTDAEYDGSHELFRQPPGLIPDLDGNWITNPKADNINNLRTGYYPAMAQGQTADFIKVFCLGEWGSVGFGKKVYPEYNDDLHSLEDIKILEGHPIQLGWDFGLTPACVVLQITPMGQMLAVKEYTIDNMGIKTFVENIVLPGLKRDFPGCNIESSYGDPSGVSPDQIMEELSAIGILNSSGIPTQPGRSNIIEPRLQSVRFFLNRMVDGKPAFVVSRRGCPMLRRGFVKDYCYRRVHAPGEERFRDVPDKNIASHIHDALQYVCMEFAADQIVSEKAPKKKMNFYNPAFNWV